MSKLLRYGLLIFYIVDLSIKKKKKKKKKQSGQKQKGKKQEYN